MNKVLEKSYDQLLDEVEVEMHKIGTSEFESLGFFCGGMFIKPVMVPKGSYITSKVHRVEHPYFLMQGEIDLYIKDDSGDIKSVPVRAPHIDISTSGTRRFGYCKSDVLWVTVHLANGAKTESEVEAQVIEPRENKLLTEYLTYLKIN